MYLRTLIGSNRRLFVVVEKKTFISLKKIIRTLSDFVTVN